jgi:tRNA A37 threonylcarbamoyladenosine dehydratase
MRYQRSRSIFGEDFKKLQNAKILLLGVGGVGGYCLDCLYRSGVSDITIVDFDTFEISNQNRQIGSEAVGLIKVKHLKTLYPLITPLKTKITPLWCNEFDFSPYDVVIDAIDDMDAKVAIANKTYKKLISATGGAKKIDPTKIKVVSIWKTHTDPLAKKFRYELKKSGFKEKFDVVFSSEEPKSEEMGSFMAVTGSFGLTLCSLVVKRVLS